MPNYPFSPLFVGSVAETAPPCPRRRNPWLSVPFSSGRSLKRIPDYYKAILTRGPFSPLFVGSVAETRRQSPALLAGAGLSVPFSSGRSLKLTWFATLAAIHKLSVPFSSGRSLKPSRAASKTWPPFSSFSPLFVGSVAETKLLCGDGLTTRPFSPLFVGSVAETAGDCGEGKKGGELSVPFSSGRSLKLRRWPAGRGRRRNFQSPFRRVGR